MILKKLDSVTWSKAMIEARTILINCARNSKFITYSDLVNQMTLVKLDPHTEIGYLLGDISRESNANGEGLFSVLVVHKYGDLMPGEGFFELGEELGYDVSDKDKFWIDQYKKVIKYWKER